MWRFNLIRSFYLCMIVVTINRYHKATQAFIPTSKVGSQIWHHYYEPTWVTSVNHIPTSFNTITTHLSAQASEKEAKAGIDKVVAALRKDSSANKELGKLEKVTIVLGYGIPSAGTLAVRFNASFRKTDSKGLSAVPLPFGLGQSNVSEGRGTMVGQVKASIDIKSGKIISCSVFRDLGYGRAFNLKV